MNIELVVEKGGTRLDALLAARVSELSRARIKKAILEGCCLIDEQVARDPALKVAKGQKIVFSLSGENTSLAPSEGPLHILWADDTVAVLDKPAGLVVHPCPSCSEETLCHRLLSHFPQLAEMEGQRPGIVHRLDRDTSGLILVALTERARLVLSREFAEREVSKKYLALVYGRPPLSGECNKPLGRHPSLKTRMTILPIPKGGRAAHSSWQVLWSNGEISLLEIAIKSGRTHQIRVHMAHLGYPLLGDQLYASGPVAKMAERQMLHAWKLSFRHPFTDGEMRFCVSPPEDFFMPIQKDKRIRLVITGNQGCGKSAFCDALEKLGVPVISADGIVAELYGKKSEATEWIGSHISPDCLSPGDKVDKAVLFSHLQEKPWLKRELETVVHGLVRKRLEEFWKEQAEAEMAGAEIPLYFESGLAEGMEKDLPDKKLVVVGVNCPKEIRFERIFKNRHWSREKTETMEAWQWPEGKKMASCDIVVENTGSEADLGREAEKLVERLKSDADNERRALTEKVKNLCQCPNQPD